MGEDPVQMMVLDVRRSHFYAKALRRVFVEMPKEDSRCSQDQSVAELIHSLYGTRDAAANWEASFRDAREVRVQQGEGIAVPIP